MKPLFALSLCLLPFAALAQQLPAKILKDTDYFYCDTVDKKAYTGDYKPTGLIAAPNNSFIISNELSIYFPEMYDTSKPDMDSKKFSEYEAHQHNSSGSIFSLNNEFKKNWQIILKEKRVKKIAAYDDTTFIAAGDNTDMRKIWVARIGMMDGKILWLKEFAIRHESTISELGISKNHDIVVLSSNRRIIPISIRKQYYKTRILLFQKAPDFEYMLSLSSLSGNGKLNWIRRLDFKNRYDFQSRGMALDTNINVLSWYEGFDKKHGKYIKQQGENAYSYNLKGHKFVKKSLNDNGDALTIYKNGWVFVNIRSDSLAIEKLDTSLKDILSKEFRRCSNTRAMVFTNGFYYLFGYISYEPATYLICKLDTAFNVLRSWRCNQPNPVDDAQLSFDTEGRLVILGMCYKKPDIKNIYTYINLVKLDLQ